MLTEAEIAEMRRDVEEASDRVKAAGKPVVLVRYVGGPLDGLVVAKLEPLPIKGSVGVAGRTATGIVQVVYDIGEQATVRTFREYVDNRGGARGRER